MGTVRRAVPARQRRAGGMDVVARPKSGVAPMLPDAPRFIPDTFPAAPNLFSSARNMFCVAQNSLPAVAKMSGIASKTAVYT